MEKSSFFAVETDDGTDVEEAEGDLGVEAANDSVPAGPNSVILTTPTFLSFD
jgi:hypothetical protein